MDQQPLNDNLNETPPPQTEPAPPSAPQPARWSAGDTWLGLGLLLILLAGYFLVIAQFGESKTMSLFVVATFEFILVIPVAVVLGLRKAPWVELGLRRFNRNDLVIGCGLLVGTYFLVIINNLIMVALGIVTQADTILEMMDKIDSPIMLAFVTVIVAPVTEELFFRGFLFKGLREKYGWVNALVFSSIIFALFHGQIATLIPTFLLGALFAYMYQRTESVFPGMILHFTVNAVGICALLLVSYAGGV